MMNNRRCKGIMIPDSEATAIQPLSHKEVVTVLAGKYPHSYAIKDNAEELIEAAEYLIRELRRLHNESL